MPKSKRKMPERWENYKHVGSCISGTRLMAFKVPLKRDICIFLPPHLRFSPSDLIKTCESEHPIGLVIDLTNTSRYYDQQEFQDVGIEYQKLFTEGHVVPKESIVTRFIEIVNEFLSRHSHDELLVGVHCTHGVNRTGYLICRFLIETLNWTSTESLKAFAEARGHAVERKNYIAHLHEKSMARQKSKSASGHVKHMKESVTQPAKTGQRSRQNSASDAGCRHRTVSPDKRRAVGTNDSSAIDPSGTKVQDTKLRRKRKNPRVRGERGAIVDEDLGKIDRCQSTHKRSGGKSYRSKNTEQFDHETHFPLRITGQSHHQQQSPMWGHSHQNHDSEVRGQDAIPTYPGRPSGQSVWARFPGHQTSQQPVQSHSAAGTDDHHAIEPSQTQIGNPRTAKNQKKLRRRGGKNGIVYGDASKVDGCQSMHKWFGGKSYMPKNTEQDDYRRDHETHFPSRTRWQSNHQQQNPMWEHSHQNQVRGLGAVQAYCGRPSGQSAWANFHGYQTYRQPMHYSNEYSEGWPVLTKRNRYL